MNTLTLELPDTFDMGREETVQFFAAKLYESGKLSLGQAAAMAGMKKWDFPAVLAKFGVDYIQYTYEDVVADVQRIAKR